MPNAGTLYVVATPIGNLEDMTPRAIRILSEVDLIAAEDTRHSGKLLKHFGIEAKTEALHGHNERSQVPRLIDILQAGKSIAFITDAGTPLVSDPGAITLRVRFRRELNRVCAVELLREPAGRDDTE